VEAPGGSVDVAVTATFEPSEGAGDFPKPADAAGGVKAQAGGDRGSRKK